MCLLENRLPCSEGVSCSDGLHVDCSYLVADIIEDVLHRNGLFEPHVPTEGSSALDCYGP